MIHRNQKPKREPWIKPRKRVDESRMDSCPEAKQRDTLLRAMGCIVCGRPTQEVHHLRAGVGMGMRAPWWRTIPLCWEHHANASPFSVHGRDRKAFFLEHGDEEALLVRTNEKLERMKRDPSTSRPDVV